VDKHAKSYEISKHEARAIMTTTDKNAAEFSTEAKLHLSPLYDNRARGTGNLPYM